MTIKLLLAGALIALLILPAGEQQFRRHSGTSLGSILSDVAIRNTNRARRASRRPHFLVTLRFWAPSSAFGADRPVLYRSTNVEDCPLRHFAGGPGVRRVG